MESVRRRDDIGEGCRGKQICRSYQGVHPCSVRLRPAAHPVTLTICLPTHPQQTPHTSSPHITTSLYSTTSPKILQPRKPRDMHLRHALLYVHTKPHAPQYQVAPHPHNHALMLKYIIPRDCVSQHTYILPDICTHLTCPHIYASCPIPQ